VDILHGPQKNRSPRDGARRERAPERSARSIARALQELIVEVSIFNFPVD